MPKPLYTKKGDKGETDLYTGEKIEKINERVEAYGTVDELNSSLGIAKVFSSESLKNHVQQVQERLFYLATELATTDPNEAIKRTEPADISNLEKLIDNLSKEMPPAEHFVVPGGTKAATFLHLSRTICRRAERHVIRLSKAEEINIEIIRYLNRLSDYLFVLARYANLIDGEGDQLISRNGVFWQRKD